MNPAQYCNIPHVLELNRVKRAYHGGKLLDIWQGLDNPQDGNFSEEFLISTVEVTNQDKANEEGLSKTVLPDGEVKTLSRLISQDYLSFLGKKYAEKKDVCVSARVGDTIDRHVLQCHPDTTFARKRLGFPNGKSEAWYIVETRDIDGEGPYLYAGFKPGVTKELWTHLFNKQDIPSMLKCMHKIPVHVGGVYFVSAGMPHCMGPGNVFLEVHEPCDYTFRAEKNYLPDRTFSDYEMNYGLGMDGLMDAFHYETYTEEEILQKCVLEPSTLFETEGARAETIVSYRQAKRFQVEKYTFTSDVTVPAFDGHRISITVKGACKFSVPGYTAEAAQGRGVFLPHGAEKLTLQPVDGETIVLLCYPPDGKIFPEDVFRNPIQVGVLVKDLDRYLQKLQSVFGIGPFRIAEYPPKDEVPYREYHGKKGNFTAKFCFYHLGNIELELIQPISGENIWDDFIGKHGYGLHHIKFLTTDAKAVEEHLKANGYPVYQQGAAVGPNKGRVWQFYPTYEDIGFDVEMMNE